MTAADLAAACGALLGRIDGPVVVAATHAPRVATALRRRWEGAGDSPVAAVVVFLGETGDPRARARILTGLRDRLPPGAALVVADHNQPRTLPRRVIGSLLLAVRGRTPARARYPVAREVAALGFVVESLRLEAGERIQLVRAVRS